MYSSRAAVSPAAPPAPAAPRPAPAAPRASAGTLTSAANEAPRPVARALALGSEHVGVIDQSHERCAALGLSRIQRPEHVPLSRSDLAVTRERNQRLYTHAAPIMEMLHEQIAGTESMVVLCDATGTILHATGDDDFLSRASKVALAPGVNWSEHAKGTNAIGTALTDEVPTLVHADEHYMHANHFLTCSAAPILDPRGNILGVLDVTGDHRSYHRHTMGLVRMSARMIENHWLSDDYRHVMRLHFHQRAEFIGTLMEGILAVSSEGRIVGANRGALDQLGLSGAALRMHTLASLFETEVAPFVDHFRSPIAAPLALRGHGGRQFHAVARFEGPAWGAAGLAGAIGGEGAYARTTHRREEPEDPLAELTRAMRPPPAAAATAPAGSALAELATGDATVAAIVGKIRRVIDRDIPILVLGETGTGKELLARAIRQDSSRARQPFVAVNCASIPETLIEAELFGYEEGAFTGARKKGAVGKIVQASGGTLFLDEIGDMPLPLQAHLLRVLQERQVTPLASRKSVAVDVAIVCATHRHLREMIAAGQFREDLYYRLNGLALKLPPLRERSDLHAIAQRLLARESVGRPPRLSPEVEALFEACAWPGNVRQLFNVLRTACVMAAGGPVILREHLSDDFLEEAQKALAARREAPATPAPVIAGEASGTAPAAAAPAPDAQRPAPATEAAPLSLGAMELAAIRAAVEAAGGNISVASKRLAVSRNTIYRKLRWNVPG
jgi:transcriptional regulator of acetoin/glycerol metabolism